MEVNNIMKNYSFPLDTRRPDDRELADVLTAISVVSRMLARKLTVLASKRQAEGGRNHKHPSITTIHDDFEAEN